MSWVVCLSDFPLIFLLSLTGLSEWQFRSPQNSLFSEKTKHTHTHTKNKTKQKKKPERSAHKAIKITLMNKQNTAAPEEKIAPWLSREKTPPPPPMLGCTFLCLIKHIFLSSWRFFIVFFSFFLKMLQRSEIFGKLQLTSAVRVLSRSFLSFFTQQTMCCGATANLLS